MSREEVVPDRRRRWLREIGKLFARIDDACARGDYESARTSSEEVVRLLALTRPLAEAQASHEERDSDPGSASSHQRS